MFSSGKPLRDGLLQGQITQNVATGCGLQQSRKLCRGGNCRAICFRPQLHPENKRPEKTWGHKQTDVPADRITTQLSEVVEKKKENLGNSGCKSCDVKVTSEGVDWEGGMQGSHRIVFSTVMDIPNSISYIFIAIPNVCPSPSHTLHTVQTHPYTPRHTFRINMVKLRGSREMAPLVGNMKKLLVANGEYPDAPKEPK
ncbi:hypothetical protein BgiMline_008855 [Biomphalaria glabrata]|nr:hypothetical protein BgiMline_027436 [Biomphalaria glabrata]